MSSLITNATIQIRKDTAGNWTSNNPTPAAGEWCRETDTGALKNGDGSTAWNDLEYRQQLPFTNDLTSANITHTLPKISGHPQVESIYWENGGTYKLTLAVTDSETIDGISAGTWLGEGEGHMVVESDGTNWQVREYEDSGSISDSGVDTDRIWYKSANGVLRLEGARAVTLAGDVGLAFTITFGLTFNVAPVVSPDNLISYESAHVLSAGVQTIATTTTVLVGCHDTAAVSRTGTWDCTYQATGRWRT